MPSRSPLARPLLWAAVVLCGVLAVVGGLALRGPEVVAVAVAGVLAACMAAGIAREAPQRSRARSTLETAASVGAATVGVLLLLAGVAALAGGAVAALTVVVVLLVAIAVRLVRGSRSAPPSTAHPEAAPRHPGTAPPRPAGELASLLPPVAVLTTRELGQEWIRTTAILSGRIDAAARAALVARREETLDELERRDPAGFARWLAEGPTLSSDPAGYVHGGPLRGDPAADTDAA